MKLLSVLGLMVLVSCNSDGDSSSPKVTAPGNVNNGVVTVNFEDSTITNFVQLSGVAQQSKKWYEFIIDNAYAGTGKISCIDGEQVSVSMDITVGGNSQNLLVNGSCNSDMELQVRAKLLSAFDGHKLTMIKKGLNQQNLEYTLNFISNSFEYNKAARFRQNKDVINNRDCFVDYTFNDETGLVASGTKSAENNGTGFAQAGNISVNNSLGIPNPNIPSLNNYEGCRSGDEDYTFAAFRFKNGQLEIDRSGTKQFDPNGCVELDSVTTEVNSYDTARDTDDGFCTSKSHYDSLEVWCIDNNQDRICD